MHHVPHFIAYAALLSSKAAEYPDYKTAEVGAYMLLTLAGLIGVSHAFWHWFVTRKDKRQH